MTAFAAVQARVRASASQETLTLRPFWLLASIAAALLVLWFAVARESIQFAAIPIASVTALSTVALAAMLAPGHERRWLTWVVALTFMAHMAVATAIYMWIIDQRGEPVLFPDEHTYARYSLYFADVIRGGDIPEFRARNPGYFAIVTGSFLAWGHDLFWPRIFNVAVSALLVVPVYGLANALFGRVIGRRSAIAIALSPTFVVFPAFMMKDAYLALLVTLMAWKWVEIAQGQRLITRLMVLGISAMLVLTFRLELVPIMLLIPMAWMLLARGGQVSVLRFAGIVGFLGAAVLATAQSGFDSVLGIDNLTGAAIASRQEVGGAAIAERAAADSLIASFLYGEGLLTKLIALPAFVLQPLIQPIPNFRSELAILMLPAMLFLYMAFPFAGFGIWRCLRQDLRGTFLLWALPAILLAASYASLYVAFRYRIQYEPLLVILAVVGFSERARMPRGTVPLYICFATFLVVAYLFIKST